MPRLSDFLRKPARKLKRAAGRAARRTTRRALPNFFTPDSWDAKPSNKQAKSLKPEKLTGEHNLAKFLGRSLGSLSRRLRGGKSRSTTSAAVLLVPLAAPKKPRSSSKPDSYYKKLLQADYLETAKREELMNWLDANPAKAKKLLKKEPGRKRKKGERGPDDPRFLRSQAKYEARKNDSYFQVNPSLYW